MSEIQKIIFSFINKKKRNPKSLFKIKNKIFDILNENNKLFRVLNEKEEFIPYIQLENNEIYILNTSISEIESLFTIDFGVDIFQNKFAKELFNHIKSKTASVSPTRVLYKYSTIQNNKLYMSCGKNYMITMVDDVISKKPNGYDSIYFDSNYVYPEWDVEKNIFPESLFEKISAFNIDPMIPDGIHVYTKEMQRFLLEVWLISVLLRVKPMPILLFYGNKSSGKTLTSKCIMKLFNGKSGNVSIFPDNKRSLMSCITEHSIYTIDNLDSKVQPWFNDTLTLASTGGELSERALFSNSTTYRKEIVSSIIITSRNANFAKREDIKDRVLPIFFNDRIDYSISEEDLIKQVLDNRNLILTHLFTQAQKFINHIDIIQFNEKYRFTTFGKLIKYMMKPSHNFNLNLLINCIISAQFNSLTDIDPLIQSIFDLDFKKLGISQLEGTPLEIIKILETNTSYVNTFKPRVFARKLKENSEVFQINNWILRSDKFGHSTKFFIHPNI